MADEKHQNETMVRMGLKVLASDKIEWEKEARRNSISLSAWVRMIAAKSIRDAKKED
jgi:hypothetical protein